MKNDEAKRGEENKNILIEQESVKKQKSQDHYLYIEDDRLKGHHSATSFDLIIATVDCYN